MFKSVSTSLILLCVLAISCIRGHGHSKIMM
jgi:hypothetical protein